VNGHDRDLSEICESVRMGWDTLDRDSVLGVVVNRADPELLDEIIATFERSGDIDVPVWAIPETPLMRQPSLDQLAGALGATRLTGDEDDFQRMVQHVKVAAMSVPNLLDHLDDGTVLLTPGDRHDVMLTAAMTRQSTGYPGIVGVVLTGGLVPDERVLRLLSGVAAGKPIAILTVGADTLETAVAAARVEGAIRAQNGLKIEAGLGLFEDHVDLGALAERIQFTRSEIVTPVMFEYDLIERARAVNARIVLPEGTDDRILRAADRLRRRRVCELVLLGNSDQVRGQIADLGLELDDVPVIDPLQSELLEPFAERYAELRAHKGITLDRSRDIMADASFFGTMMVREGLADGMVSGAAHTTAHTIRPALEFIKTRPGVSTVSSCFLMLLEDRILVYADCAIIPDPDDVQLADIAFASADTARLFGIEPRVAMLSYSTGESGTGADVDKVRRATERVRELHPELPVEGPIQYDAAIDVEVARSKLPGSAVAGHATVFVFPDLNTGNNTYKAVQRSANAVAVGPILQGLNRPVNDLSRGATVTDIVNTVAITVIQAGDR
jgi:phosphate acetyltransferase